MARIDESIERMRSLINEIKVKAIEQNAELDEKDQLQVDTIAKKTIDTIQNSINKLEEMKSQFTDETQLEDFLSRLDTKCEDVKEYTIIKISEFKPVIKEAADSLKENLEKTFNQFTIENKEEVQEIKEEAQDIKEEIQEKVEDVKEDLTEQTSEVISDVEKAKDEVVDTVAESIEKILKNENVKNVIKFIIDTKERAVEIYNMPETQKAINDAKLKIIDLAEKGLDTLKVALEKDKCQNKDDSENI